MLFHGVCNDNNTENIEMGMEMKKISLSTLNER